MILLDCGHTESTHLESTRGYGTDAKGKKYCYECCAIADLEYMREHGKITLYLTKDQKGWKVNNWHGSLEFRVTAEKKSSHNIGRTRHDAWFRIGPELWHSVQIGEFNQIARCNRNKGKERADYDRMIEDLRTKANIRTKNDRFQPA